jgi:hypothetical protein
MARDFVGNALNDMALDEDFEGAGDAEDDEVMQSCERNWSLWGSIYTKARSRLAVERPEKLVMIRGNTNKTTSRSDAAIMLELLEQQEEQVPPAPGPCQQPSPAQGGLQCDEAAVCKGKHVFALTACAHLGCEWLSARQWRPFLGLKP